MAHRATPVALAALLVGALPCTSAANGTVPIRSLTYAVETSYAAEVDAPPGWLAAQVRMARGPYRAGGISAGEAFAGEPQRATGSIAIDVLQATSDVGLVIDIAETTNAVAWPKVRMAIARNGTLSFNPVDARNLSDEEVVVARWLDRGFYGERPTDVGTAWVVDLSANGDTDLERYRVVSHDERGVTLAYSFEERTNTAHAYAGTRDGSLVYDPAMEVPVKATYEATAQRRRGGTWDKLRMAVKLSLVKDSFEKPTR